jgi:integrase
LYATVKDSDVQHPQAYSTAWTHRGRKFVEPKSAAGHRSVPLDWRLVEELRAYRGDRTGGLVFATRSGKPMSPPNARRDVWLPLLKRAGVPHRDMCSLRSPFASLARTHGEAAFNVSRMMGHSRCRFHGMPGHDST